MVGTRTWRREHNIGNAPKNILTLLLNSTIMPFVLINEHERHIFMTQDFIVVISKLKDPNTKVSMNGVSPFIEICDSEYDRYMLFTLVDEDDIDKVIDALFVMKQKQQLATILEELAKTNSIIKSLGVNTCIEIFDTNEWNMVFNPQITSTIKGKLDELSKRKN